MPSRAADRNFVTDTTCSVVGQYPEACELERTIQYFLCLWNKWTGPLLIYSKQKVSYLLQTEAANSVVVTVTVCGIRAKIMKLIHLLCLKAQIFRKVYFYYTFFWYGRIKWMTACGDIFTREIPRSSRNGIQSVTLILS
jgi:hypothetical protein